MYVVSGAGLLLFVAAVTVARQVVCHPDYRKMVAASHGEVA